MGPRIDPKWKKNGIEKQSDFKTKLAARTPGVGPRSLPRQRPPGGPPYARALFPKQSGQDEEGRRREEGRKEERKKGRRGKKDKREEKSIQDDGKSALSARGVAIQERKR